MQNDFRPQGSTKPASTRKPTLKQTSNGEPTTPFETPDQVSEHDQAPLALASHQTFTAPPRGSGHHWFNLPWPPNRHEIILAAAVLVLAIGGTLSYALLHHQTPPVASHKQAAKQPAPPAATTVASTLSGLSVAPEVNQRPVVGVMIENSTAARPQAGLSQAGVVFEAIAEGGVTRFLALFQDQQPSNIGPIRSARPYYIQWNEGFHAAYVHVGGSPDALADIKAWSVQDINQFYNAGAFHRVNDRPSPHNMYSNVGDLATLAGQKGYSSNFTGFMRKSATPSKQPTATSIDLGISSAAYNPHYSYDAKTNRYLRSEGGAAQTDSNSSAQLSPDVVIAMVLPLGQGALDASGAYYSNYNPLGSGTAYIFQDGLVTTGTWNKPTNTDQLTFTDGGGKPIRLNPGQAWISAVTDSSKVVYK